MTPADSRTRAEQRTRGVRGFEVMARTARTCRKANRNQPASQHGAKVTANGTRRGGCPTRLRPPTTIPEGLHRPLGTRPWSRTGENPPYGILEGALETERWQLEGDTPPKGRSNSQASLRLYATALALYSTPASPVLITPAGLRLRTKYDNSDVSFTWRPSGRRVAVSTRCTTVSTGVTSCGKRGGG